jgi:hypothetical protein
MMRSELGLALVQAGRQGAAPDAAKRRALAAFGGAGPVSVSRSLCSPRRAGRWAGGTASLALAVAALIALAPHRGMKAPANESGMAEPLPSGSAALSAASWPSPQLAATEKGAVGIRGRGPAKHVSVSGPSALSRAPLHRQPPPPVAAWDDDPGVRTSPPPVPTPAPAATAAATPAEAGRMLDTARRALAAGAPAQALETLQACGSACLKGPLEEDGMALKIQALAATGNNAIGAAVLGEQFLKAHPNSAYAPSIAGIVGPGPSGPGGEPGEIATSNHPEEAAPPETGAALLADHIAAPAGDPAQRDGRPWALLTGPEPGDPWAADVLGSESTGDGGLRVLAMVRSSSGETMRRTEELLSLVYSAAGDLTDVDPVDVHHGRGSAP